MTDIGGMDQYTPNHKCIVINGVQVLSDQQAAIADLSVLDNLLAVINSHNDILAVLRNHGLIST